MKDDFDLEKELAQSIAHIVDEETSGAETFVKNSVNNIDVNTASEEPEVEDVTEEPLDDELRKKKLNHLIITIVVILTFLSGLLRVVFKIIGTGIIYIAKLLFWILTFPFRIIGAIIRSK